jgi:hypothetical protein
VACGARTDRRARGRVEQAEGAGGGRAGARAPHGATGLQADVLLELVSVLETAGRRREAAATLEEAARLYGAKGNVMAEANDAAGRAARLRLDE